MEDLEIRQKIAVLESVNDQLYSELQMIDGMMRSVGFVNGLNTVKATAQSINEDNYEDFTDDVA